MCIATYFVSLHGHCVLNSPPPTLYRCRIETWDQKKKGKIIDIKLVLQCAHLLQLKVAANYLLTVDENCFHNVTAYCAMIMYVCISIAKTDRKKNEKEGGLKRQTSSHLFLLPNIVNHTFV